MGADRVAMRDLYQISDVLFMPSLQEGFGIPLLEAGMIKLPIVCSDIPPFRSITDQDVLYFSLEDDAAVIASHMLQFLDNLPTHTMYRRVIRNYVWDNIYKKDLKPFLDEIGLQAAKKTDI